MTAADTVTLAPALDAVRLTLHVLAAAVFVGGQITVAGLLPTVRGLGEDAPRRVARQFARLQWPAFGVVVLTGFWNIGATSSGTHQHAWSVVLGFKIAVVAIAGIAAGVHSRAKSKALIAATGAIAGLASLTALALGVLLAG